MFYKNRISNNKNILFFDGTCVLCNRLVDFLIRKDKTHLLYYSSLQGETAKNNLAPEIAKKLDTIVFFQNGNSYIKSNAILQVAKTLGGGWQLLYGFKIIPRFIRDLAYNLIANNRYKWFGENDICRIPTKEDRGKLLP